MREQSTDCYFLYLYLVSPLMNELDGLSTLNYAFHFSLNRITLVKHRAKVKSFNMPDVFELEENWSGKLRMLSPLIWKRDRGLSVIVTEAQNCLI